MLALCPTGNNPVTDYDFRAGKLINDFGEKLGQLEDFCDSVTAIASLLILCIPQLNSSRILKHITTAIAATGAITTLLIVINKIEEAVTGKICCAVKHNTENEAPTITRRNYAEIFANIASLVARLASTALVLNAFGAISLGAHQKWLTTTVVASLSTAFVLGLFDTMTECNGCSKAKTIKLTSRTLIALAIPGTFNLIPSACPLPLKATCLAVAGVAWGFSFFTGFCDLKEQQGA